MELMLEKNFDGKRLTIVTPDETKLDAMFFPFNDDKLELMKVYHDADVKQFQKHPTIILFNQNAQTYQHQVHSPNCFWLKYFLNANVNVMTWNYRGYGRSEGVPDPFNCL